MLLQKERKEIRARVSKVGKNFEISFLRPSFADQKKKKSRLTIPSPPWKRELDGFTREVVA